MMHQLLRPLYQLVDAKKEDGFFMSLSHAEALHKILFETYLTKTRKEGRNHYLIGFAKNSPEAKAAQAFQEMGCIVEFIEPPITAEKVQEMLSPRTALLSAPHADPLTGLFYDFSAICELCQDRNILLHLDISAIIGKMPFSFREQLLDRITFQGKSLDPMDTTTLLFAKNRSYPITLHACLQSLSSHAEEAIELRDHFSTEIAYLRDFFEEQLLSKMPQTHILFRDELRLPHISALQVPLVASEALAYFLYRQNICSTPSKELVSFTFAKNSSKELMQKTVEAIHHHYLRLQEYYE